MLSTITRSLSSSSPGCARTRRRPSINGPGTLQRDLAIKGKDEALPPRHGGRLRRHDAPHAGQRPAGGDVHPSGRGRLGRSRRILWAAGLRVTAAWNIVTETESALKEGNYVQGTVCLVLRKRLGEANARRMEIEAEIEEAVAAQLARLTALDEAWHGARDALHRRRSDARGLCRRASGRHRLFDHRPPAARPRPLSQARQGRADDDARSCRLRRAGGERLAGAGRFPERHVARPRTRRSASMSACSTWRRRARRRSPTSRISPRASPSATIPALMASTTANAAALAGAADLKGRMLDGEGFAGTQLRQVLFAVWKTMEGDSATPNSASRSLKYRIRRRLLAAPPEADRARRPMSPLRPRRTRPEESAAARRACRGAESSDQGARGPHGDRALFFAPRGARPVSSRRASTARRAICASRGISAPRCWRSSARRWRRSAKSGSSATATSTRTT